MLSLWVTLALAAPGSGVYGGEEAPDEDAVGLMTLTHQGSLYTLCSGTLVDPLHVLTAAHCAVALEEALDEGLQSPGWGSGADVNQLTSLLSVESWFIHPDYGGLQNWGSFVTAEEYYQHDLALLRLKEESQITPLELSQDGPDALELGADIEVLGFGVTSDDAIDAGTRRKTTMQIIELDQDFLWLKDEEEGSNLCYGDSGGPGLNEQREVVGVNSFVFGEEVSTLCVDGGSALAHLDLDWLEEILAGEREPDGVWEEEEDSSEGGGTSPSSSSGNVPFSTPEYDKGCGGGSESWILLPLLLGWTRRDSLSR